MYVNLKGSVYLKIRVFQLVLMVTGQLQCEISQKNQILLVKEHQKYVVYIICIPKAVEFLENDLAMYIV